MYVYIYILEKYTGIFQSYIYIYLSIYRSIYLMKKKQKKTPTIPSWIGSMGVAARIFDNVVGLILNCNGFGFFYVY